MLSAGACARRSYWEARRMTAAAAAIHAALTLAEEYGLPVFPCRVHDEVINGKVYKAKSPLTSGGFKDATQNLEQIEKWWHQYPDALVGVPTGKCSRLFAVDVDPRGADWYATNTDRLKAARIHKTLRGHHLLYRDIGLGCSTGSLADGVDTRGEGGYIIWWPAAGQTAVGDLQDVSEPPAWVAEALKAAEAQKAERLPSTGGIEGDRSKDLLQRVGRDVRNGLADYEILERHRNHPHARDQTDPGRAVQRCIDKARSEPATKRSPAGAEPTEWTWTPPAVATYGVSFDPTAIPLRQWLILGRLARGEGTAIAGPPGTNKSSLLLVDAVQLVTGRSLLGDRIDETGDVLFLVGEDRRRDYEARLAAVCTHYHLPSADLRDRLHVVYQSEINPADYTLAGMLEDMATINANMLDWVRKFPNLVALLIDPMISWHRLIENDNNAMQVLCVALRGLAVQANIAVAFDHHVTKVAMFDCEAHVGTLAALRGGSAIAADMRWAFTMAKLKPETASHFGIGEEDRKLYRRLDTLKASYGPDDDEPRILKIEPVRIANGETVGVLRSVDAERLRADGKQRLEDIENEHRATLADALLRMLREKAPRSTSEAALWIASREPQMFVDRKGAPQSERTIYRKLAVEIGAGLAAQGFGITGRIVMRVSGTGNGARREIDFEEGTLP
jgi:hypothetical protein